MNYKTIFICIFSILLSVNILSAKNVISLPFEYSIVNDSTGISTNKENIVEYLFYENKNNEICIPMECVDKNDQACFMLPFNQVTKLRNYLIFIKQKFISWTTIAKQNKINSFSKYIFLGGSNTRNEEINSKFWNMYLQNAYYSYTKGNLSDRKNLIPDFFYFVVDKHGNTSVRYWSKNAIEVLKGAQLNISYIQGFWSTTPVKTYTNPFIVKAHKIIFTTPEQIQSLIDALNIDKAKSMYEKQHNTVDQLFK